MKEIAETLGGGIKEGSLMLIEGDTKSGKSVLSQYIAYGVLSSKDCSVAYYITENGIEDLISSMDSMMLYVRHARVTDRFRINALGKVFKNPLESLGLLSSDISELPGRFKLAMVDSLSPMMTRLTPTDKIDFLKTCKEICELKGRSIILTMDNYVFEKQARSRAHDLSDYYLNLKSSDMMLSPGQVDTRVIRILEISKLAGADCPARPSLKFEIKPHVGIQILPLIRIRV
jgi:archaellum biogenesis ATPase FlaH